MMRTFSERTSKALQAHTLFRIMLPPFQSFLDVNVRKEIEKDRFVITTAYDALSAGTAADEIPIPPLLYAAREIDRKFLQQAATLPVTIDIRYEEIEQIRQQRMERLLHAVYRIFNAWNATPRIRVAVANCYTRDQFLHCLGEILHLYNQETRILSHSVHLPRMVGMARDKISDTVYSVMETTAQRLARELAQTVYRYNG